MSSSAMTESAWSASNLDVNVGDLESYVDLPDTGEIDIVKNDGEGDGGQLVKEQEPYARYATSTTHAVHGFESGWTHINGDGSRDGSNDVPEETEHNIDDYGQDHETGWVALANVHLDQTIGDVTLIDTPHEGHDDAENMDIAAAVELTSSADTFVTPEMVFSTDSDTNTNSGHQDTVSPDLISQPPSSTTDNLRNHGRTRYQTRSSATLPKVDSANSQTSTAAAKQKNTGSKRGRKVYCICRQPDDGDTMIQCDICREWYHIACINLSEEEADKMEKFSCDTCRQVQANGGIVIGRKVIPQSGVTTRSRKTNASVDIGQTVQDEVEEAITSESEQVESVSCVCLYPGCPNPARDGDDYCSDQCTVKDSENVLRRLAAKHTLQTQHVPQPHHHKDENRMSISEDDDEEEERHLRSQRRRSSTASAIRRLRTYSLTKRRSEEIPERSVTPPASSPLQLTPTISQEPAKLSPEHDPIRRNVIKNMADTLKKIVTEALEKDPELFASPIDSPTTPKTPWSDSPMAPMETQIQQKEGDKDTTESSKPASMPTSAIPSADELSDRLSRSIELAMFEQLADPNPSGAPKCGERYKGKFRSLLFNLKDKANEGLRLRVVTGELPPEELVRMSAEDMANPALKSMSEVLRKRSIKDSVLKTQPVVAFIKKTHKGEVYMSTEPTMAYEREEKENDRLPGLMEIDVEKVRLAEKENINSGPVVISPTTPTTRTDTLEEILARMGNGSGDEPTRKGKRASVDFPKEWQSEKKTRMSPKFDLDDDMFDLRSDSDEDMEDLRLRAKRKRDLSMQEDSTIIDKSSRSPNYTPYTPSPPNSSHTPNYSPPPSPSFPTGPIWRGKLQMAQVAQFEAVALQIGGRLNNGNDVSVMWEGVLSASTIAVEGRIPVDRVTDYLTQTQFSSTKELTLIEFRPVIEDSVVTGVNEAEVDGGFTEEGSDKIREAKMDDNSARFDTLLEYFSSRSRFGVVGVKHMPIVKDMYIVPLRKDAPLPDCLVTMEHQLVEGNRDRNMMLGIVVVNKKLPPSTKKSVRKPKEMRRDTKDMELSSESLFRDSPRDGETEDGEKTEGTMLDVEEEYVSQEPLEIAMNGLPMPNAPATNPTTINMPTVSMIPTPQLPAPAISTNLDPLLSQLLNNPDVLKLLSVTATGLNANAGSSPTSAAGIANPSLALNLSNILIPQPAQAPLQQYIPPMTAMPLPPQAGVYESTAPILPPISSSTSATVPPQYQAFYNQQQFENPASQAYDPANPSAPPAHSSPPAGLALSALSSFYDDPHTGHQDRSTLQNVWEEEWGWESRERGRDPRDRGYHPDDRERERDYRGRDRDRGYRGDGGRDGRDYHPYPPRDREREWGDEEEAGHRGRDEHWRGGSRNVRGGGEWRGRGRGGTRGGFEPRGGYPKRGRGRGRGGYEGW